MAASFNPYDPKISAYCVDLDRAKLTFFVMMKLDLWRWCKREHRVFPVRVVGAQQQSLQPTLLGMSRIKPMSIRCIYPRRPLCSPSIVPLHQQWDMCARLHVSDAVQDLAMRCREGARCLGYCCLERIERCDCRGDELGCGSKTLRPRVGRVASWHSNYSVAAMANPLSHLETGSESQTLPETSSTSEPGRRSDDPLRHKSETLSVQGRTARLTCFSWAEFHSLIALFWAKSHRSRHPYDIQNSHQTVRVSQEHL